MSGTTQHFHGLAGPFAATGCSRARSGGSGWIMTFTDRERTGPKGISSKRCASIATTTSASIKAS